MKINPRPLTLCWTSSRLKTSWGRGITTLMTSPYRLAISLTSSRIYWYSSSIANSSTVTICFNTRTLPGGHMIFSVILIYTSPPIASTFFMIVSILESVPNFESNCLLYSIYCLGRPSFSCFHNKHKSTYPNKEAPFRARPFVAYWAVRNSTKA